MNVKDDLFKNVKKYSTYIRVPQSIKLGCLDMKSNLLTSVLIDEASYLPDSSFQILNWFI
jgi:hypothetical protein